MKEWRPDFNRHSFILYPFAFILFLILPVYASAQQVREKPQPCAQAFSMEEAEREFASAVGKYEERFEGLVTTRGVQITSEERPGFYLSNLEAALATEFEKETAVLFYDEGPNGFRVWLIDGEGIRAFHSRRLSREQLESAIASLRMSLDVEDLEAARLPPRLRPKRSAPPSVNPRILLPRRLSELTDVLLPDAIRCQLKAVSHLIVVPILDLGTVPFAALRPFGPASSLIDKMSVTIAPSLSNVGRRVLVWSANFRAPLFVGNPYLAPSAGWEALENAELEARAVGQMFQTPPLLGRDATKEKVLANVARADFLYFATHGAADTAQPLDGGFLVFSGPQGAESLWTAREIQHTRLRARLAVLSACQTGLGKTHDAGVIGLARAFQLAGVPRVVMSLWSVYDEATAELMQAFARHLRAHAPAEALRQAMLEVRRRRPNPVEWASFVIFGTPQ